MSYLVFARKFRPQTFEQVVGQKAVVKTLRNSLKRDRVAHAILFSGVRGVGKTTLARLMAKALNCEQGPTPLPCNECRSCTEITKGSALDLLEIDGASNRGIQEVRELKDKIKFMPTSSRFKIVIIDEVHMLTNEAFNALLKTLEEPPAHVYFMFATTELHKIPVTILSRCQRYELQRVSSVDLRAHFSGLVAGEGVSLAEEALSLIVREAEGSVRDGLSLLDQVLSYGESVITLDDVVEVLGLVKREHILGIAEALLSGDRAGSIALLAELFKHGMDIKRFTGELLECYRTLLLIRIGGCEQLLEIPDDEMQTLRALAQSHSTESIHQQLSRLMQTAEDLRFSLQPRLTLETSFLAIIEAGNVIGLETLLEKIDNAIGALPDQQTESTKPAEQPAPAPITFRPTPAAPRKKKQVTEREPPPPEEELVPETPDTPTPEDVPLETVARVQPTFSLEPSAAGTKPSEPQKAAPPPEAKTEKTEKTRQVQRDIRKDWTEFISHLKREKEWMAQTLQQTSSVREAGTELLLEFDNPNDCFVLRSKENRQKLTEYILDFFQRDLTIRIVSPNSSNDNGQKDSEGPKKRRQQLAEHHLVRMTEEIFNGRVGSIRISDPNK